MPPEPPSARRISPDLQGEPAANHRPQRPHAPARRILPDEPGGSVTRERERALAALAARQHGRVSRAQLLDLGLTKAAIDGRLAQHRLQRVHGGVYAVGYTSSEDRGRLWAAWLACAPDAAISHQSAAAAWGLWRDRGGLPHVTAMAGNGSRTRAGLIVHRTRLTEADVTDLAGLPVTTVARTLIDLGDLMPGPNVRQAFVRAEQQRLVDMDEINAALERGGFRRGPSVLRGLLRGYDPRWQETRSSLELRMLDVVARAGVPEPEVNAWIDGSWEADLLWREARVVVEVDGAAVHTTPSGRRRDALRDRALRGRGYRVLHVPEDALDRPERLARRLRRALAGASGRAADTP